MKLTATQLRRIIKEEINKQIIQETLADINPHFFGNTGNLSRIRGLCSSMQKNINQMKSDMIAHYGVDPHFDQIVDGLKQIDILAFEAQDEINKGWKE